MNAVSQPRLEISISRIQAHKVATAPIYSLECMELHFHSTMRLHSAMLIKNRVNFTSTFHMFQR
jgi:hypothetical protein